MEAQCTVRGSWILGELAAGIDRIVFEVEACFVACRNCRAIEVEELQIFQVEVVTYSVVCRIRLKACKVRASST